MASPCSDDGWQRFVIPAGSRYQSPGDIHVEADASSASYFIALGRNRHGADGQKGIKILGVGLDSIQGDIRFVEAAQAMGAQVHRRPQLAAHVQRGAWPLKAIDLDCNHIPDAAMTLAAMALYADGTTTLRNIASWRVKETDRIAAMATELRKLGATRGGRAPTSSASPRRQRGRLARRQHPHLRRPPRGHVLLAGRLQPGRACRCASKTPSAWPRPSRIISRPCSPWPRPAPSVPVICIDGPTASGKGTVAGLVAQRLGFALARLGRALPHHGLAAIARRHRS